MTALILQKSLFFFRIVYKIIILDSTKHTEMYLQTINKTH